MSQLESVIEDVTTNEFSSSREPSTISKRFQTQALNVLLMLFAKRKNWNDYGKLTVFFKGFFVISPVKLWWWMSEIFVISTVVIFTYEFFFYNWVVLVPAIILATLEWLAFYKTCMKDPGVQIRPPFEVAFKNALTASRNLDRRFLSRNGAPDNQHYCWRCHHYRAVNTNHCATCDCCMIQHDHHCPVYGGCVAKNNMPAFQIMIFTMATFWFYTLGFCIYKNTLSSAMDSGSDEEVKSALLILYTIMFEICAVILIPPVLGPLLTCVVRRCKSENQDALHTSQTEKIAEMLRFVRESLSPEDEAELQQILQALQLSPEDDAIRIEDNINHNSFKSVSSGRNNNDLLES